MDVLNRIRADPGMERLWENYRRKFEYAEGISWDEVMGSVEMLYQMTAEKKEEKSFEKKAHIGRKTGVCKRRNYRWKGIFRRMRTGAW